MLINFLVRMLHAMYRIFVFHLFWPPLKVEYCKIFSTALAARTIQKVEFRITQSFLMQDWVFIKTLQNNQ